jgi:hypothetical protein
VLAADRTGRDTRWTACAGTAITYDEVRLGDLCVQVKQNGPADLTDAVLRTVHA